MSLKVGVTPTTSLVQSNKIFVPTGTLGGRTMQIFIPGSERRAADFVFLCEEHPEMQPGSVGFNKVQRECAKLSTEVDTIALKAFDVPRESFTISAIGAEVDFMNPRKINDTVALDVELITQNLTKLWDSQIFTVDQQMLFDYRGTMFKLQINEIDIIDDKTGTIETSTSSLKAKHYMGQVKAGETKFRLRKPRSRPGLSFENVPPGAESMNTQLLKSNFDFGNYGIGGLDAEADQVFRRAFASRIFPPSTLKRLGISHVKGILLFGPPGCGKTLMARQIGKMLNCKEPKVVNGPEILSKFVGESEKNVRALFAEAEEDQRNLGDESELHLIIFDEFDAIVKQRGSTRDNTGVSDSVVNQLLAKIDGVDSLNNVLLVGMTNRRDLLDDALLRPGRFEVQIEIQLPDLKGRNQIFTIHTKTQRESGILSPDVDLAVLSEKAKNYTGAEIEGVVKAASSFALNRLIDYKDPSKPTGTKITVTMADFIAALDDVKPAFGAAKDLNMYKRRGIFNYGLVWEEQIRRCMSYVLPLKSGGGQQIQSVLLEGAIGTGKTALAAHIGEMSGFPFIKVVSGDDMTGFFENSKVNYIKKAFDDAHKSPYSVVILDEIEDLIDYVSEGPRFSSPLLQTLRRSIKRLPPEGSRILIVGTTSKAEALRQLDFFKEWDVVHKVLELSRDNVPAVLSKMDVRFVSETEERGALNSSRMPEFIPIKKLMQVAEMARSLALDKIPELSDSRHQGTVVTSKPTVWHPITLKHWETALENLGINDDY
eukprot:TRINITY_DN738_c1_g1_i1.p1 TRINITY_DN738_c1_g1~~TRINITY_DN738_c1_g1_i1.p1  ORF type:complete len:787 (+),score=162.60 TRINITY_DN738_c1_g1_i1:59-2362(+)